MSRKNAPNGGFMSGFGFGNFPGMSDPGPEPPREKGGGHAAAAANRNATEPPREKGNGNATTSANKNATESAREKGNGHAAAAANGNATGPPKGKGDVRTAANVATAPSENAPEPPAVPGLAELVEVLDAMAAATLGARPKLNQDLIEVIRNSPLQPVLNGLQPIYKKLGPIEGSPEHLQAQAQAHAQAQAAQRTEARPPTSQPESTPGPGPSSADSQPPQPKATPGPSPSSAQQPPPTAAAMDVAEIKNMQAGLRSLSSTLDAVAQVVTDVTPRGEMGGYFRTLENNLRQADSETRDAVKASATAAKTQIEAVDKKVSQMSGKLDPLAEVTQGVKRLQAGLLDEAKAERARLETTNKQLENQVKELEQVIQDTRAELLPVEAVSKIALQGSFSDEPNRKGGHGGNGNATPNLLQTAKRVRTNMLGLVAKWRTLFAFINRDPETESDVPDLGKEGEWGQCVQRLRASNSKLRNAVEEKEETAEKLQFIGFVVDQIRKGHYTEKDWESDINWKNFAALVEKSPDGFESIQLLAQDLSRHIAQVTAPVPVPNGPTTSTASAGSGTSTTKPTDATPQVPAVTALSSPVGHTIPIPSKKDREVRNAAEPPVVPGLPVADLVELINALTATPPGGRPQLNAEQIERIKKSPLRPVLQAVQPIYRRLVEGSSGHGPAQANPPTPQPASTPRSGPSSAQQPTPAAAPAAAGVTNAKAGLRSLSSKLNSVSQAVTDMKESTKAAKDQVDAVDKKVSQISGRLDPALAELTEEVKRLEVDLVDEFNTERTQFEKKVKGLEAEVKELKDEAEKLRKGARELQQVINDTTAELLPVEAASKIALQGTFSGNQGKISLGSWWLPRNAANLLPMAKRVRTNTTGLITKCRTLFALINHDTEIDPDVSDPGMEDEWGLLSDEYLQTSNSKLRNAVKEKEETTQKLQLVGLVLDQMRKGHSVQILTQDLSRRTEQPAPALNGLASSDVPEKSKPSTIETVVAVSQVGTSLFDLNTCGYLS